MPTCASCGEENPDRARFCLGCGTQLAVESAREVLRTVTVLFCDLVGSTALGERLDPEALRRVLVRYYEVVSATIQRHGGAVDKYIGDAVVGVFGAPVVREDDALRAVRAAAELGDEVRSLNGELQRAWGIELAIRVGVNTGRVLAVDDGTAVGPVLGDAVNVAARLEAAAGAGEVLLGHLTWQLVRSAATAESLGPLAVKGRRDEIAAWRLTALHSSASPPAAPDVAFVGRLLELGRLREVLDECALRRTLRLVTVIGAGGIGKSSLAREVGARTGARRMTGRCLPYGEGITLWPVAELVRQAAGIQETDSLEDTRAKLDRLVSRESGSALLSRRLLAALGDAGDGGAVDMSAIGWAVRRLLGMLARDAPVIVVFEDLHWAEPALLDLIVQIAESDLSAPVLMLALARPELLERRPGWGLDGLVLELGVLSDDEADALAEASPAAAVLDGPDRAELLRRAGGNPFFLEQLLAAAAEDGAQGILRSALPPTVEALLADRLGRLFPEERVSIERGAVIGELFWDRAVAALAAPAEQPSVGPTLASLVTKDLLRRVGSTLPGAEALRFRHILIRDAAYVGIPKSVRAELHERFAGWLEGILGDRVAEYQEILGYHLEHAHRLWTELGMDGEVPDRIAAAAAAHLGESGRRAGARGDIGAANDLLRRAADLLPELDGRRVELLIELGMQLADTRRAQEALNEAMRAAGVGGHEGLQWRAQLCLAEIERWAAPNPDLPSLEDLTRRALTRLEQLGDDETLAYAWYLVALLRGWSSQFGAAEAAFERALSKLGAATGHALRPRIVRNLMAAAAGGPTPTERALLRCEALLPELAGGYGESVAEAIIASLHAFRGEFVLARELLGRARASLEGLSDPLSESFCDVRLAQIELLAGNPAAAEVALRRSLAILRALGETSMGACDAALLAVAVGAQGRLDEAEELARTAMEMNAPGEIEGEVRWRIALSLSLALAGRGVDPTPEQIAREAVTLSEPTDMLELRADAEEALGLALERGGQSGPAGEAYARALGLREAKGILPRVERPSVEQHP
jgi:class 3 adenylate cyclase/tetratricopeptide (TPR) repeat protein